MSDNFCVLKGTVMNNSPYNNGINTSPAAESQPQSGSPVIPEGNTSQYDATAQNQSQEQYRQGVAEQQPQIPVYNQYPQQSGAYPPSYTVGYPPTGYNTQGGMTPYTPAYYTPPVQPVAYNTVQSAQQSPSTVYYNNQVTGTTQYHYGVPMSGGIMDNRYFEEQQRKAEKRRKEEKVYRDIGNSTGIAVLVCFVLSIAASLLISLDSVSNIYNGSLAGLSLVNMMYTIIVVGGSFFICKKTLDNMGNGKALRIENKPKNSYPLNFAAPKNPKKAALMIAVGMGGCIVANYISSLFISFLDGLGVHSTYSSIDDPKNMYDIIALFIGTAVMPALIEELSLRGILLTPMRKYGNAFAILASAYVFGIFHGDVAQIPFAFICGLFFGYIAVVTDSLWPTVIVHFLNNSLSCVSSVLIAYVSENAANIFYYICSGVFVVLGGIAVYIYLKKYKKEDEPLFADEFKDAELTLGKRFRKFLASPTMIVMTIVYLIEAVGTVSLF